MDVMEGFDAGGVPAGAPGVGVRVPLPSNCGRCGGAFAKGHVVRSTRGEFGQALVVHSDCDDPALALARAEAEGGE